MVREKTEMAGRLCAGFHRHLGQCETLLGAIGLVRVELAPGGLGWWSGMVVWDGGCVLTVAGWLGPRGRGCYCAGGLCYSGYS